MICHSKKLRYFTLSFVALVCYVQISIAQDNVGIGIATPNPKALLDLTANDKGLLVPRMTGAERTAINPAGNADAGLLVYDHDVDLFYYWNASQWIPFPQNGYNLAFTFDTTTRQLSITDAGGTLSVLLPSITAVNSNLCAGAVVNNIPLIQSTGILCNSVLSQSGQNIGLNTTSASVSLHINTQDGIAIPTGPTGARPATAPTGTIRYNTDLGTTEVFNGSCWQNINTPPIGSTYVQWFNASDPNGIYPCTQWVSTDVSNGEFIRATGGASNVASGSALTGVTQAYGLTDHQHTVSGSINGAGVQNTSADGSHSHNWGGWWSTDDSREWINGNGDGANGNTISDGAFWWGGNSATVGAYAQVGYSDVNWLIAATGAHNHGGSTGYINSGTNGVWVPFDDNVADNEAGTNEFTGDAASQCPPSVNGWNGHTVGGNFLGRINGPCLDHQHSISNDGVHAHSIRMYAHRHWLKQRPTSIDGSHTHTVPDHTHTHNLTVGGVTGAASEVRPVNQAVTFWRRVN